MTYTDEVYSIAKKAKDFIAEYLDKNYEYILLEFDEEEGYEVDLFFDLPQQLYIGKYEQVYYYGIVKVYKENESYWCLGYELDNSSEYIFSLYDEIDEMTACEIADFIKKM